MCLNEANSRIQVDKYLSHMFPIQNGLKQGDALSPLILNFFRVRHYDGSGEQVWLKIK
jgi:hypothetical protein